jgi:hypothetical protein
VGGEGEGGGGEGGGYKEGLSEGHRRQEEGDEFWDAFERGEWKRGDA